MKYTIIAKVNANSKANQGGRCTRVDALLRRIDDEISFFVFGKIGDERQKDRTLGLCFSLVQAGYAEFEITYQEIQEE
jgi:hypothetical protein